MNTNTVISLQPSADLSAYSDVAVKLTSTGAALAGPGDRIIGTMTIGNDAPPSGVTVGSAYGSITVFLSAGNGLHAITVGNNSALVMGDELEAWPSGRFGKRGGTISGTGQVTGDTITITNHGLVNGTPIVFTVLTTGSGLTVGVTYYVISAAANTFQVALTSGGSAVDITGADYTVATLRPASSGAVAGQAVDSCPASSLGGVLNNAILFNGQPTTGALVLKAATTLTSADSGKEFFLDLAGGFTVQLPPVALGLKYSFIVKTAPTTAYILLAEATNDHDTMIGYPIASLGSDETGNGNALGDQVNFVASTALPSDRVDLTCDGSFWYVRATCKATGAITITG